jgi:hypothetical protein
MSACPTIEQIFPELNSGCKPGSARSPAARLRHRTPLRGRIRFRQQARNESARRMSPVFLGRARSAALPDGQISEFAVQPLSQKYSCFVLTQITSISTTVPTQGAYRDRHGRGAGCGGRGSVRRDRLSRGRMMLVADGEVVWSCRPDAGVKLAGFSA